MSQNGTLYLMSIKHQIPPCCSIMAEKVFHLMIDLEEILTLLYFQANVVLFRLYRQKSRPSQIMCTIMTVHVTCTQTVLRVHENWFLTVLIPLWKNSLNLPISHRPLCFNKIRTTATTAFLISNTVVLNPFNHSATYNPQTFAPLQG